MESSDDNVSVEAIHQKRHERLYFLCVQEMKMISELYENQSRAPTDEQIARQNTLRQNLAKLQRQRVRLGKAMTAAQQDSDAYLLLGVMKMVDGRYEQDEQPSREPKHVGSSGISTRLLICSAMLVLSSFLVTLCFGQWQTFQHRQHNPWLPKDLGLNHPAHAIRGDGSLVHQHLALVQKLIMSTSEVLNDGAVHLCSSPVANNALLNVTEIRELQDELIDAVYIEPATQITTIANTVLAQSRLTPNPFHFCSSTIRFLQQCTIGYPLFSCTPDYIDIAGRLLMDQQRDAHTWQLDYIARLDRIQRRLHRIRDNCFYINHVLLPAARKYAREDDAHMPAHAVENVKSWASDLDRALKEAEGVIQRELRQVGSMAETAGEAAIADEFICAMRALSEPSRRTQIQEVMSTALEREIKAKDMAAEMKRRAAFDGEGRVDTL